MTDQELDAVLAVPGIYRIYGNAGAEYSFYVEVDSELVCHQLTLHGERDGVLNRDGWDPQCIVKIVGGPR